MSLVSPGGRRRRGGIFAAGAPPVNIHVEGNSIGANYYTSIGTFDNHLMAVEPLASSGATHSCSAVSGSDWAGIISRGATVDAAWDADKTNVLVINEHINALYNGASVATIQAQVTDYLAARLAAHPWRVIYWRTLPYGGGASWATMNDSMVILDDWVEANAITLGISAVVEPRTLAVFNHDGKLAAPFESYNDQWQENATPFIHPLDAPKLQLSSLIVSAMESLTV